MKTRTNIANPRLTLNFHRHRRPGGSYNRDTRNGSTIANTGGITLANLMLGYVTSYSYAQQGKRRCFRSTATTVAIYRTTGESFQQQVREPDAEYRRPLQ